MSHAPESTPPHAPPTPRRRGARASRILAVLVLVVVALMGATIGVLAHLEHPWVKPTVLRTARAKLGLDVDYRSLSIDLLRGHVSAAGLTVAQPPRFRPTERTFLSVDSLSADANVRALASGEARLSHVELRGVAVTYVADERTDTVSLLFPPSAPPKPTPLSHSLDVLHDLGVDIGVLRVDGAKLRYVTLERRAVSSRVEVDSLTLTGHLHAIRGEPDLRLRLVPEHASGTTVVLDRASRPASADGTTAARPESHVRARLALDATLAVKREATLALTARVLEQTGLHVPEGAVLATTADVAVGFDPRASRTHLAVRRLSVADELLVANLASDVEDRASDVLRDTTGELRLDFEELPFPIEGLEAEQVHARASFENAVLSPSRVEGRVDAQASARRVGLALGGRRGGAEELALTLATDASVVFDPGTSGTSSQARTPRLGSLRADLRARTFHAEDAGQGESTRATLRGDALHARVRGETGDAIEASVERLELARGRSTSADVSTLVLRAEGPGLARALASSTPANGRVTLSAAHLVARDGGQGIDVSPVEVAADLHDFLASGTGLFGLGGRAEVRVDTAGTARNGAQRIELTGLVPTANLDFDHATIDGSLPFEALSVQERGATTLAVRGADLRFSSEHATTLAPPTTNGRVKLEGSVARIVSGTNELSVPSLSLEVKGDHRAYAIAGSANLAGLRTGNTRVAGTHPVRLEGQLDPRMRKADLAFRLGTSEGEGNPRVDATLHAEIDPHTGGLTDRLSADASNLDSVLGFFLPEGTQAHFARAHVDADGRLVGLFARTRAGASPELAPDFAKSLQGDQRVAVALDGVDVRRDASRLESPRLELALQFRREAGADSVIEVRADSASLVLTQGPHRVTATELHPAFTARVPDLSEPMTATLSADVRLANLEQRLLPEYPVSDVRLTAVLETRPTGAVLRDFVFVDEGSLASLHMTGAYERELGEVVRVGDDAVALHGREAIALEGVFDHDLAPLAGTSLAQSASGHVTVPFTIESGDLASFHCRARVVATNVHFVSADGSLSVSKLAGDVPVEEVVVLLDSGTVIDPGAGTNPLARMRFPDVQPFLGRDSFVTADRIAWQDQELGPLAGNLRITGTMVAMDHLEVGYRGGRITGQLVADLRPGAASIALRADATGIHSRRNPHEILDANVAMRFDPEALALDGTAQLVRLGRSHLLDMLDVFDPFHEDPPLNRVRSALRLGYPKFVRIRASEGLMQIQVKLGGLASAVHVNTVHAIPIAPILEERVAPYVDPIFHRSEREERVSGREESELAP